MHVVAFEAGGNLYFRIRPDPPSAMIRLKASHVRGWHFGSDLHIGVNVTHDFVRIIFCATVFPNAK